MKTGFGRSGEFFAVERLGLEPDLMRLGKAMGGGAMPIGALLGTERALGGFDDVSTGSTWAWLPAACAAALATLDTFEREDGLCNTCGARSRGARRARPLADEVPAVGDVRVLGGFIAIEFVVDRRTKERDTELQAALARECLRRGVLADSSTTSLNLQPSLVMPEEAFRAGLAIVRQALLDLTSGRRSTSGHQVSG